MPPGILTFTVFASRSPSLRAALATAVALDPEDRVGPSPRSKTRASILSGPTTQAHCRLIPFLHGRPAPLVPSLSVLFAIAASLAIHFSDPSCSIEGSRSALFRKVTQCGFPTLTNWLHAHDASIFSS